MKKGIFLLAVTFILTSCDPYGGYQYQIENNSDSTLFLEYKELYNDTIFTKQIQPKKNFLIKHTWSINGIHDYGNDFLKKYFTSLEIFTDSINGTVIQKNFTKRENWSYDIEVTGCMGNCGENIYTFKVDNSDL